jgi:hypothetical protein
MILLIKLLLAHLLGDFVFQPNSWATDKVEKKLGSIKFYLHIAVYTLLIFVIVWDWKLWKGLLIIILIHFIVDTAKILLQRKSARLTWFITDQALHFIAIVIFWVIVSSSTICFSSIFTEKNLAIATAIIFLTIPTSVIIRELTLKWADQLGDNNQSLKDAGKYIGMLERLLVFIFILFNRWEAIGFLLAAKSIFRFGDLKDSKELKLTEYMLIGTLLSFGIAIGIGLLVNQYCIK